MRDVEARAEHAMRVSGPVLFVLFFLGGIVWAAVCVALGRLDVVSQRFAAAIGMCGFYLPAGIWVVARAEKPSGYDKPLEQLVGGAAVLMAFGSSLFVLGLALVIDSDPFNPAGSALLLPGAFFFLGGTWLAKVAWQSRRE